MHSIVFPKHGLLLNVAKKLLFILACATLQPAPH